MWTIPAKSQELIIPDGKIQNRNQLLITDNWSSVTDSDLPCLNSSSECIDLLTEKAIAHSNELQTIETRIGLLDMRLGIASDSIDYAENKMWTNYIPDAVPTNPLSLINPFSILKNVLGGGDIQREKIAIADLQLKKANVEVQRAGLERRYSEVQEQTREKILTLVLEYEAAVRQVAFIVNQLNNHRILFKVMEIDYRFGGSSTDAYLKAIEKQSRLENQLIQAQTSQRKFFRKILFFTGLELVRK